MYKNSVDITVVCKEVVDEKTAKSVLKIRGGSLINVKSIFGKNVILKDVIVTDIVNSIKQNT